MPTDEEKIEASKSLLLSGSLLATIWVALGAVSCWLINPLYGWLFIGFSAFSILIVIRRLMCTSCYYCKSCTKGFAKLSKLFLGSIRIPGINRNSAIAMTAFIYVLLTAVPSALLALSTLQELNYLKLLLLVSLLSITAYDAISRAKNR